MQSGVHAIMHCTGVSSSCMRAWKSFSGSGFVDHHCDSTSDVVMGTFSASNGNQRPSRAIKGNPVRSREIAPSRARPTEIPHLTCSPASRAHHQGSSSGLIRSHQGSSSGLIRAHHQGSSSGLIRAHQGSSGLIRAHHQGSSGLIRAHHQGSSSDLLTCRQA